MKGKSFLMVGALVVVAAGIFAAVTLGGQSDLDLVRDSTEGFQTVAAAEAAGFVNVNVDECVASPEGAMGYHFVNFELVDLELNSLEPEIMVFIPQADGSMRLGAVEYAVPIEPWDAQNDSPPTVMGQTLHPNPVLGLYVLHAWLYENNPAGMYADWNPNVSCEI